MLLTKVVDLITGRPTFFSFDPITGVPASLHLSAEAALQSPLTTGSSHFLLEPSSLPSRLLQAVLMPGPVYEEAKYIRPILLLDGDAKVFTFYNKY
ncbi:unnamed protein product [Protopolystoma xenopodis]|uniref:Uncharacterized protein n=1 Tax=Protopolystoma xenopodis TaxID=117903 RepID=A0A3S5CKI1_9PLAT|nr:unnamed protein product [Protopolystoma xenopodis]